MSDLVWLEDDINPDNFVTVVDHARTLGTKVKVYLLPHPEYDLSSHIESQEHPLKANEVSQVGVFLTGLLDDPSVLVWKTENPRVYRVTKGGLGYGVFLG